MRKLLKRLRQVRKEVFLTVDKRDVTQVVSYNHYILSHRIKLPANAIVGYTGKAWLSLADVVTKTYREELVNFTVVGISDDVIRVEVV